MVGVSYSSMTISSLRREWLIKLTDVQRSAASDMFYNEGIALLMAVRWSYHCSDNTGDAV